MQILDDIEAQCISVWCPLLSNDALTHLGEGGKVVGWNGRRHHRSGHKGTRLPVTLTRLVCSRSSDGPLLWCSDTSADRDQRRCRGRNPCALSVSQLSFLSPFLLPLWLWWWVQWFRHNRAYVIMRRSVWLSVETISNHGCLYLRPHENPGDSSVCS